MPKRGTPRNALTRSLAWLRQAGEDSPTPSTDPQAQDVALATLTSELWGESPERVERAFAERDLALFERRDDHHYVHNYFGGSHPWLRRLPMEDPSFYSLAREVRSRNTTFLHYDRLYVLFQALEQALAAVASGDRAEVLEVGVWRGGGSWFLGQQGERLAPGRVQITSVDTFEGHSAQDLRAGGDGVHRPGKFAVHYEKTAKYLAELPSVELIKARIQDAADALEDKRFALVHVDVDIYEPTRFTLEFVRPRMARGGIVIVDDYGKSSCPGATRAVDEFVSEHRANWFALELQSGQYVLAALG